MKIGIITYHYHSNYGTMLQAFALQKYLETSGNEAEIIDFRYDNRVRNKQLRKRTLKDLISYFLHPQKYFFKLVENKVIKNHGDDIRKKDLQFKEFLEKNINLSNTLYRSDIELSNNPPLYDIYMVGSDQTWNPNVGGNPDSFYLSFVPYGKLRASYAPSISITDLTKEQESRLKVLLKDIQFLSCREKKGSLLLERILDRQVETVVDPTLLLNSIQWRNYQKTIKIPCSYILQYLLGYSSEQRDYIKRLSKKLGLPIVVIPANYKDMSDKNAMWCGPSEFLYLIDNASLVCTDSFHGSVFSVNFRKPVYTFFKHKRGDKLSENSRIIDLYEAFGLSSRIIENYTVLPDLDSIEIDYSKCSGLIDNAIENSKEYLNKILSTRI